MRIGDILNGTYQIERPLGMGGQARVWQARHLRLPRTFAIKECPLPDTDPRERADRRMLFERERDILAALSHPGHPAIPKVSDFWEEADALFLVMDLVEGETLIDLLIRRGRVTMPEAINWGMQLCDVLAYLHSWHPPIIYRDLSPDNVMQDRGGQLHLIDFGIARTFKPGQAQNTSSLGKAGYASPEHLDGGKSQTDVRSDIYSLGALLYHLLTGQEPIAVVERLKQRARLQGGRALIPPRTLNLRLTSEVERCILQAMELEPAKRFQNAVEMKSALERCNASLREASQAIPPEMSRVRTRPVDPASLWGTTAASTATPPSLPPHPQTPNPWHSEPPVSRRRTGDQPGVSSPQSPMSGGLGPSPLHQPTGPSNSFPTPSSGPLPAYPSETPALLPGKLNRPSPTGPTRMAGNGPTRTTGSVPVPGTRGPASPNASHTAPPGHPREAQPGAADRALVPAVRKPLPLVPARSGPRLSRRQLLIGVAGLGVAAVGVGVTSLLLHHSLPPYTRLLTVNDDNLTVQSVAWSPDGRLLAGGGNNMLVKVWNAQTGNLIRFLSGHTDFVQGVAWSPDGANIASASADTTVRIWDALQGGPAQVILSGHDGTVYSVAWSPDGSMLASASADKTVRIWDTIRGGDAKIVLTGHTAEVYSVVWSPDGNFIASSSADGTVKIWSIKQANQLLTTLDNHTGPVRGVSWSPDSKQVAAAALNRTITVWNLANTPPLSSTLTGAPDALTSVAWSQDGSLLAAGSQNDTVLIWTVGQNSPPSNTLSGHSDAVTSVAWSTDSSMLAAASADGTIIIWQRQS